MSKEKSAKDRVAIIGVGQTSFGEQWDRSIRRISLTAATACLADAGVRGDDIDALYVSNTSTSSFIQQEHQAVMAADSGGLLPIASTEVEAACASGGVAVRHAYLAVKSGEHKVAMVIGCEKMSDISEPAIADTLMSAADREWEGQIGATFPSLFALLARRHMHRYGTTPEQLAAPAVKAHANAVNNPYAQFRFKITTDQVLKGPIVADPLRMLHCAPISDGAAAAIIVRGDLVDQFEGDPIWIEAATQASDTLALHDRPHITTFRAVKSAAKQAYDKLKMKPDDVEIVELHDSFSISEIISVEDLGFVEKGKGGKAIEEGFFDKKGTIPTNVSGGLKAKGHPVGATGIAQVAEIVEQLRGTAGKRQVKGVRQGLTLNLGGTGSTAVLHILKHD
ncbi:MAG: thiolase domain-containing protein [Candidatus Thorarchaeota archaeon]